MSIVSEIIAVIEAHNGRADRLAIMATLHAYSQGSVEVMLSGMTKRGAIVRVSKGVYELPKSSDAAPAPKAVSRTAAWLADGLAPYQRVRLYIEANGPPKKQALLKMLAPHVDGSVRVLGAMVVEHAVHQTDDGRIALGRNPKMPAVRKHVDPRIEPRLPPAKITPEEAVEPREASADATSEKPASTRVDVCAGDAPDESAAGTIPAQEIGPAPVEPAVTSFMRGEDLAAEIGPPLAPEYTRAERREGDSDTDARTTAPVVLPKANASECALSAVSESPAPEISPAPAFEINRIPPMETDMTDTKEPDVGKNDIAPGAQTAPVATFHVELPGLHIAINGEAKAVMQAVAAIEKTLA